MAIVGLIETCPTAIVNKSIELIIKRVVLDSNGFPGLSKRQYINAIKSFTLKKLSDEQIKFIENKKINLDELIITVTKEATKENF